MGLRCFVITSTIGMVLNSNHAKKGKSCKRKYRVICNTSKAVLRGFALDYVGFAWFCVD